MSRETEMWADCWYPWLANGWIKCDCGQYFHSREGGARATDLHAEHVALHHPLDQSGLDSHGILDV